MSVTAVDIANAQALNQAVNLIRENLAANSTALVAVMTEIVASFTHGLTAARLKPTTFANLPASPVAGWVAFVTDATANTWGHVVSAGSGTDPVLVWFNGTNWTVVGQ